MNIQEIKKLRRPTINENPHKVVAYLCLSIFLCEMAVMSFMATVDVSPKAEIILDPIALVLLLGPVIYAIIIGPLRRNNQTLWAMANTDALTCTFNRLYFMEAAEREVAKARRTGMPLSLLMIDIDFFKRINDTFGHPVGDLVLVQVAETLAGQGRAYDILARYGGEEFVVLLPETSPANARIVAERYREHTENIAFERPEIKTSASIGVATLAEGESLSDLLKRADKKLYLAKENGRNRIES